MKKLLSPDDRILLTGKSNLLSDVALCLLNSGHSVTVVTENTEEFHRLLKSLCNGEYKESDHDGRLTVYEAISASIGCSLVIILSNEIFESKTSYIQNVLPFVASDTIVAINMESISLSSLIQNFDHPERFIGLNWTEPVHTTLFLEIIESEVNHSAVNNVLNIASKHWSKDPYIVKNEGIRSRLISAMTREAVYLVDNGYASIADVDRACRNDAGYYLPFCGNCRYMDLMGAYAYGRVMKDLNPDLSKETETSGLLERIEKEGRQGMINNKGFYDYTDTEVKQWKETMEKFSYQIQSIMEKYPFDLEEKAFID